MFNYQVFFVFTLLEKCHFNGLENHLVEICERGIIIIITFYFTMHPVQQSLLRQITQSNQVDY